MAPSPHDSDAAQVRLVLGLSGAATDAEIQAAYWALRAHIEARAGASEEPGFIAARTAELQHLTEQLALALDVPPDSLPAPDLETTRAAPQFGWIKRLGMGIAGLGVLALLVFGIVRDRPDDSKASPLAAVASAKPPGRLIFDGSDEGQLPHRYTVLDAEGQDVVRTGVTAVGSIELEPGEYSVWLSGLACDASRQHSILVESEAEVTIVGPDCQRTLDLVVRSDVTGDRVSIDGEDVGGTGPEVHTLGVGEHQITVQVDGQSAWRTDVEVGEDDRITLHARLRKKSAGEAAAAEVRSTPPSPKPPAATGPTAPSGVRPQPRPETSGSGRPESQRGGVPGGTGYGAISRDGRGGSRSWHDGVQRRLVGKYDTNDSASLDTTVEIASIPCTEWRAIESQYEAGGLQVPMTRLYGFDGSDWVQGALGIEESLRDFTYRRMKDCGLK